MRGKVQIAAMVSAAVLSGGAVVLLPAFATSTNQIQELPQRAAFSQTLGSKQAVGFFQEKNGRCVITLMVAEALDEESDALPPSAARFTTTVEPAQSAMIESEEQFSMKVTCGPAAQTVLVERNGERVM
jgi:hypothetical protein